VLEINSNRPHLPTTPNRGAADARLRRAIEALILALLAGLLPRRSRVLGAWHPIPEAEPSASAMPGLRLPGDGTHLVIEASILYVIGPGPNRGLRPRPRATPIPRPRLARAPPATPQPLIRRGTLRTRGVNACPFSLLYQNIHPGRQAPPEQPAMGLRPLAIARPTRRHVAT